ncbi:MAG TPA: LptA/OstA family protein [Vicinamibacterales bacterium]|nr:LptA/OstA family protein [Vicinamibacterales bacterium]
MGSWQQRARWVVAVFGIVSAVVVYFAIGRRHQAPPPAPVKRIDPAASAESVGGSLERRRGDKRDFLVTFDTQLLYPDGRSHLKGHVSVTVTKDDGRTFVTTAGEAEVDKAQNVIQLSSGVSMKASDGFAMTTDHATYTRAAGAFHTDGPIEFSKARMNGSGAAVDYDENNDVLTIGKDAHVTTVDTQGQKALEFSSGSAIFDRRQDLLTLDGSVRAMRDKQVMEAAHAVGHLAPNDEFVTFIELRGDSRVSGGDGPLDAMRARDIDLDYTDDGQMLERVALTGTATLALAGSNGAAARQLTGEMLEVRLAADNSVSAVTGRDNVVMTMPSTQTEPPRRISGKTLDATGAPGQGLTAAHFTDTVEYREDAARDTPARVVHAGRLDLALTNDVVANAVFTTGVTFEEQAFRAQAAEARYDPTAGTLQLTGADRRGAPCIADDQISVDSQSIDVAVETRRLTAEGDVKTSLQPKGAKNASAISPCAIARQRSASTAASAQTSDTRLPGLLKQDQVARITANHLDYEGTGKPLTYTGSVLLTQGDTWIRGNRVRIDQDSGDLLVTGGAHAMLAQGTGEDVERTEGLAEEISYSDARRRIEYRSIPGSPGARPESPKPVRMKGPQGDLTAKRIDVVLQEDGHVDHFDAEDGVTATIGKRKATGRALNYVAAEEKYTLSGARGALVHVVDDCNDAEGMTAVFFKSKDALQVDGGQKTRATTTKAGGSCQASSH